MYAKDPRDGWHPLMRQMPDQLISLKQSNASLDQFSQKADLRGRRRTG
jgi:hypothetical protein